MSSRGGRLYPDVPRGTSLWVFFFIGAIGLGLTVLAVASFVFGDVRQADLGIQLLFYAICSLVCAGLIFRSWWRSMAQQHEWREIGGHLGLAFSRRVGRDELEPFEGFVLFRHAEDGNPFAGNLLRGAVAGQEMLVLELGYLVRLINPAVKRGARFRQTIVIVPDAADMPEFHLTPRQTDWHDVTPGWPEVLNAGETLWVLRGGPEPSVLRARHPQEVSAFFTPEREDFFVTLPGWTVETWRGHLLIYREDKLLEAGRLPEVLSLVQDVVRELRRPVPWRQRPEADEPPPDDRVQTRPD